MNGKNTYVGGDDPVTGYLNSEYAYFGVGFVFDSVRFYEVSRQSREGTTWVVNTSGTLGAYVSDILVPCFTPVSGGFGNYSELTDISELEAAGPFCFKDVVYTAEFQVSVTGSRIHGLAHAVGALFPAPIAGYVRDGYAYFAINYLGINGVRFYVIQLSTMTGTTWTIYDSDSSYNTTPHACQLVTCGSPSPPGSETGALHR
jgi:hypothetical protein